MGDGLKKITTRIKRLFVTEQPKPPPRLNASQIIRPEEAIPLNGKPAPKQTTRRLKALPDELVDGVVAKIERLPGGVTHVQWVKTTTVSIRDPITRRLDRKDIIDGLKSQSSFYKDGRLLDENSGIWK